MPSEPILVNSSISSTGDITAVKFYGDGSGLFNINSSAISLPTTNTPHQGLVFDGSANGSTFTLSSAIGTGDFTIVAWVAPTSTSGTQQIATSSTGNGGMGIANGALRWYDSTGGSKSFTPTFTAGKMRNVVLVRSGTTMTSYADGVAGDTHTTAHNLDQTSWTIGRYGGGEQFTGRIGPVLIYNRALSAAEVATLYESGTPYSISTSNLLLAPDAAQPGGGFVWYDTSGNATNITLPASGVSWYVPTSGKINNSLSITNTTASTTTSTGALVVGNGSSGGLGVGGQITAGGNIVSQSTAILIGNGTDNSATLYATGGPVKFFANGTEAGRFVSAGNLLLGTTTDSANGKLQLTTHTTSAGGIGFGTETSLYRTAAGSLVLDYIGASAPTFNLAANGSIQSRLFFNGSNTFLESYTSHSLILRTNQTTALTINSSQQVQVNSSTASTTTSTGALVVSGGVGVGGAINAGGRISGSSIIANNGGGLSNVGVDTWDGPFTLGLWARIVPTLSANGQTVTAVATGGTIQTGTYTGLTAYGVRSGGYSKGGTGTIDNYYGVYTDSVSVATNNYAIYTSGSNPSYFGGNITIGEDAQITNSATVASGTRLTLNTKAQQGIDIYRSDANANFSGIRFRNSANSATNAQIGWNGTTLRLDATTVEVVGNATVSGNLIINGTTTTVNSTVSTIKDPIVTLGGGDAGTAAASDDNKDRGIEFKWHNGTAAKTGFFGFDDSTGYFTFIPDATNTSEVFSGTHGDIQASNFRGNLIGDVTGNATSETFGTVTGRGASTTSQISVGTAAGGSMYTGTKIGSTYGDGISGATFKSITDNPNGGSYAFAAYYGGSGGTNSFFVGAGGNAYFGSNVGIGTNNSQTKLQVVGDSVNDVGLASFINSYASSGSYYPTASFIQTRGNHSFGVVAEFRVNTAGDTDRPTILFRSAQAAHQWRVGQVTSGWGTNDNFGIGYVASNASPVAWPTNYFTITTGGNVGIGVTGPSAKLQVVGSGFFGTGSYEQPGILTVCQAATDLLSLINAGFVKATFQIPSQSGTSRRINLVDTDNSAVKVMTWKLDGTGNVGVGTETPSYKLEVNGSFAATTKSFVIKHPTKEGKKLRYGSLEGPENGVYVRGKLKGSNVIELPDYWTKLIDPESITVQLTPIGSHQKLYVEKIEDNVVYIANENLLAKAINCFFYVCAERIDVEKLEVEIDA